MNMELQEERRGLDPPKSAHHELEPVVNPDRLLTDRLRSRDAPLKEADELHAPLTAAHLPPGSTMGSPLASSAGAEVGFPPATHRRTSQGLGWTRRLSRRSACSNMQRMSAKTQCVVFT